MKTLFAIAVLAASQFAAAQKTIDIKNFKELAVSGGIEITLVESKESKLVIESGDSTKLKVATDEGTLALSADGREKFTLSIYITGPIEEIMLSGGVSLNAKGKIKADHMNINIAGGSEVDLSIDTNSLTTAIASGAEMKLSGTAKHMEAAVASGGELSAADLKTENSSAIVASGGEAKIYATGNVNATVASGGELTIHGNPKKVNEVKADGAEIKVVK